MSEFRRDSITGAWVILTPEHPRRPGDFRIPPAPAGDPSLCPFCEGQEAIAGRELLAWRPDGMPGDGPGWRVRVVANRQPALRVEARAGAIREQVFQHLEGLGAHEVVIETPQHERTLDTMTRDEAATVLWAWRERIRDLKRDSRLKSFVIVKNHGALAGARLAHAHSQLLAMPLVPPQLDVEITGALRYFERTEACVFCDIVQYEIETDRRLIADDAAAVIVAPFAPRLPFETWLLPRRHAAAFDALSDADLLGVAKQLQNLLRRLNRALSSPPFNLVLHTAPAGHESSPSFHWHIEVLPRLAVVSGVEWGSGLRVNPVPPEEAAEVLRAFA